MSSKTTIANKNPHDKPHHRHENEEQPEAQGNHEPPHNNFEEHGTAQHQPLDAGPHAQKDTKIGQSVGTGRPPMMKK